MDELEPPTVTFHFSESDMAGKTNHIYVGSEARLVYSIEAKVEQPDCSLGELLVEVAGHDERIPEAVREAILGRYFHFSLLPVGMDAKKWDPEHEELEPINWTFDSSLGLVEPADLLYQHGVQNVSLNSLTQIIEDGYAKGDPTQIVVQFYWGIGGDQPFVDIVNWLLDVGVEIGKDVLVISPISSFLRWATRRLRRSAQDRRARKLAKLWEEHNLRDPLQFRLFFEGRDTWTVAEVNKRLRLAPKSSKQLLRALGYEPNAEDVWQMGTSKKAKRRRDKWLKKEAEPKHGLYGEW